MGSRWLVFTRNLLRAISRLRTLIELEIARNRSEIRICITNSLHSLISQNKVILEVKGRQLIWLREETSTKDCKCLLPVTNGLNVFN